MTHTWTTTVRFGDCDPAGVVYFPTFFDWFHECMEHWFDTGVGVAYAELVGPRKMGFPAVHTEADFKAPVRMGELIRVELSVGWLKHSSMELNYRVIGPDDRLRATGRTVVAMASLDGGLKAIPFPDELRRGIAPYVAE